MPVEYARRAGRTPVASSTKLLGYCLDGLVVRPAYATAAFEQQRTQNDSGMRGAPRQTELEHVFALSPNHWLDLLDGVQSRYYPDRRLPQRPANDVAPATADLMANIIDALSRFSKLAIGITTGYDSRLPLSAVCRVAGLAERALFFTIRDP